MKKTKLLYIVFFLISCLLLSSGFAQEYTTQWHVPEGAKARLGRGRLINIKFSPDGTRVAVPTPIGIWVYDAHTGEVVSLFPETQTGERDKPFLVSTGLPEALAFSPDALNIASAHGNSIYVWDTETGTAFAMLDEHPDSIKALALSSDSKTLATAGGDWTVRLWDVRTGSYLGSLMGPPSAVNAVAFSPDGKRLGSAGSTLLLWDVATRELLHADSKDLGSIQITVFSPDSKTVATGGGWDRTVHLWDVNTGTLQHALKGHVGKIRDIAFSSDGSTLATVDSGTIKLWNVDTGTEQKNLPTPEDKIPRPIPPVLMLKELKQAILPRSRDDVHSVRFSKDATQLISVSSDGSLHVWDVETGLHQLSFSLGEHTDLISVLAFSEDSKYLASNDGFAGRVRVWDIEAATQHAVLTPGQGGELTITISPGIKKLAGRDFQGTIWFWDATTVELLTAVPTDRALRLWPLQFSPDGKMLAGRESLSKNKIMLWQTDPGVHLFTLEGHTEAVSEYTFSPDSKTLASGSEDASIILWDVKTGDPLANFTAHTKRISALTFSADGKTLASGSGNEIRLWDVDTGNLSVNFDAVKNIEALAFSPDGKMLASATEDGLIQVWKSGTSSQIQFTFKGHQGSVYLLMFSPDGKTLASGGVDGTILLWNMEQ